MNAWGAISTQGNQLDLKITFLSPFKINKPNESDLSSGSCQKQLETQAIQQSFQLGLVGLFEFLEQLITAFNDAVQRFFGSFLASPNLFEFFVFNGADLNIIAQANTT